MCVHTRLLSHRHIQALAHTCTHLCHANTLSHMDSSIHTSQCAQTHKHTATKSIPTLTALSDPHLAHSRADVFVSCCRTHGHGLSAKQHVFVISWLLWVWRPGTAELGVRGCSQGGGWAAFSSGGSTGGKSSFRLTRVTDQMHFFVACG